MTLAEPNLPQGYQLKRGSGIDRALLVRYMNLTYRELFPQHNFAHLASTVEKYLSSDTPLWWVQLANQTVACLWMGNAVDQASGDRYSHIFLLYVLPEHRHQGIAKALLQQAEQWAKSRGDRKIGLQVFPHNQPALKLYQGLGFETHSLLMLKRF